MADERSRHRRKNPVRPRSPGAILNTGGAEPIPIVDRVGICGELGSFRKNRGGRGRPLVTGRAALADRPGSRLEYYAQLRCQDSPRRSGPADHGWQAHPAAFARLPFSLPTRPPNAMIRLINARKNFGRQTLYDGVDASIVRGERIGLLGKNGAGKSTLFKVLMGDRPPRRRRAAPRPQGLDRLPPAGDPPAQDAARSSRTCSPTSAPGPRPTAGSRPSWPGSRTGDPKALDRLRRRHGGVPLRRRLRDGVAGQGDPARPRLLGRLSSTPPSPPSPAAGRCGWPWAGCSPSSTTCSCSTSRRTTSTSSASSGSRTSSGPTPARS